MKTILIADSEPGMRRLFAHTFSASQCRLLEAEDAGGAREIASRRRPDLVILDSKLLPGWQDGPRRAGASGSSEPDRIPLIVLNGADASGEAETAPHPAVTSLDKPFSPLELTRMIEAAVGACWQAGP